MTRFYLVPKVGNALDGFAPKYVVALAVSFQGMDFADDPVFLLAANVTDAQHTLMAANTDVLSIPVALDDKLSALAVSSVQTKLESANLPAHWVKVSLTYRQILKAIAAMILIRQRYFGLAGKLFEASITLDLRLNQLPTATRTNLETAALSLGLDISGLTNTTTLRNALKLLGDQLPSLVMLGETL